MNITKPSKTDDTAIEHRVTLTLLGHADAARSVRSLSKGDIMDFARISKKETLDRVLANLGHNGVLTIRIADARSLEYVVRGDLERLRPEATNFVLNERARVNELIATREEHKRIERQLRDGIRVNDTRTIEIIEPIVDTIASARPPESEHTRVRFNVSIKDLVTINDCVLIEYPRRPYLSGPSKGPHDKRTYLAEFEKSLKDRIIEAVRLKTKHTFLAE